MITKRNRRKSESRFKF